MKSSSKITSTKDNWSNEFDEAPKRGPTMKRPETLASSASFDAKKYGSAKAISSDMLFGQDQNVSLILTILPFFVQIYFLKCCEKVEKCQFNFCFAFRTEN